MKYMSAYIKKIDWALKEKDAAVVISATAYPDATFSPYQYVQLMTPHTASDQMNVQGK